MSERVVLKVSRNIRRDDTGTGWTYSDLREVRSVKDGTIPVSELNDRSLCLSYARLMTYRYVRELGRLLVLTLVKACPVTALPKDQ